MARLPHGHRFQLLLVDFETSAALSAEHGDNPAVDV
jgi:hypothetical protein